MSSSDSSENPGTAAEGSEVARIQQHLLPAELPALSGYEFAVHYRPCRAAGGDYYDFQPFPDGRLGLVVADVSGHGTGAAVMMAVMRTALAAFRVFGRIRETAPQDVNAIIHEVSVPGIFVTALFVSLEPATGELFSGNCGHPPALFRRSNGRVEQMHGLGDLPLGINDHVQPPMILDRLDRGDSMVLYTDGITESRNQQGEFFGENRLVAAIASANTTRAVDVRNAIVAAVDQHQSNGPQADDQCVVVCTRLP